MLPVGMENAYLMFMVGTRLEARQNCGRSRWNTGQGASQLVTVCEWIVPAYEGAINRGYVKLNCSGSGALERTEDTNGPQ